jgi:hypothetical protein
VSSRMAAGASRLQAGRAPPPLPIGREGPVRVCPHEAAAMEGHGARVPLRPSLTPHPASSPIRERGVFLAPCKDRVEQGPPGACGEREGTDRPAALQLRER